MLWRQVCSGNYSRVISAWSSEEKQQAKRVRDMGQFFMTPLTPCHPSPSYHSYPTGQPSPSQEQSRERKAV